MYVHTYIFDFCIELPYVSRQEEGQLCRAGLNFRLEMPLADAAAFLHDKVTWTPSL